MDTNAFGEADLFFPTVPTTGWDERIQSRLDDGLPDDPIGRAGAIARRILLGNVAEREWGAGDSPSCSREG
jgi:hypothetical protein